MTTTREKEISPSGKAGGCRTSRGAGMTMLGGRVGGLVRWAPRGSPSGPLPAPERGDSLRFTFNLRGIGGP